MIEERDEPNVESIIAGLEELRRQFEVIASECDEGGVIKILSVVDTFYESEPRDPRSMGWVGDDGLP